MAFATCLRSISRFEGKHVLRERYQTHRLTGLHEELGMNKRRNIYSRRKQKGEELQLADWCALHAANKGGHFLLTNEIPNARAVEYIGNPVLLLPLIHHE